jgi:hypothetical protein
MKACYPITFNCKAKLFLSYSHFDPASETSGQQLFIYFLLILGTCSLNLKYAYQLKYVPFLLLEVHILTESTLMPLPRWHYSEYWTMAAFLLFTSVSPSTFRSFSLVSGVQYANPLTFTPFACSRTNLLAAKYIKRESLDFAKGHPPRDATAY